MPATSTATNPHGITISFEECGHKYSSIINGQKIIYSSGTQFLGKFFKPFDEDGSIAKRCAEKEGISVEELKAKWAAAGKAASGFGTRVHELCEDTILNRPIRNTPVNPKEELTFKYASSAAAKLRDNFEILGVEKIIFNEKLKIAGTIDLFCKKKDEDVYYILDWKTNKKIDIVNNYGQKALEPISHLDDSAYVHYGLQLNLYEYLLKTTGYIPKNSIVKKMLLHVTEIGIDKISLPDYQSEIRDMLIFSLTNF